MTHQKSPHSDYPPEAYALLSRAEEKHFWFRGRNRIIQNIIERFIPNPRGKSFLEIGCGTGYVLREISRMGFAATGMDMHGEGLRYAKKRVPEARLITGDLFTYSPEKKFDGIGIFDVIEHIEDDAAALRACARLLKNNGKIFLTVPARPELWSVYDTISGHKRRYTETALRAVFAAGGFTVLHIGYVGFFQYLPHMIMKQLMLKGIRKNDTMSVLSRVVQQPAPLLNYLLEQTFLWDLWLDRYIKLPLGTSLIVAAQKAL